jgi:hypothetical protein
MTPVPYSLVDTGEQKFVTVFAQGKVLTADNSHPQFQEILDCLHYDDCGDAVVELFDLAIKVEREFAKLSERVAVKGGHVLFDGDVQDGSVETQIIKFMDEGKDDWKPLVKFMENIAANPNDHSREQLYDWLRTHDLNIDGNGSVVGFKGVSSSYTSLHPGPAIVDGKQHTSGNVPNKIGSTVEIPRSYVDFDPGSACSTGLHVGTRNYAASYGPVLLEVRVNPRDVVSVPTDGGGEKIRVCRYYIAGLANNDEEGL